MVIIKSPICNAYSPLPEDKQPSCKRIKIISALYLFKHQIIIVYNQAKDRAAIKALDNIQIGRKDILLGDLNSYPDKTMDKFSSTKTSGKNSTYITHLLDNGWLDSFRILNPEKITFSRIGTYRKNNTEIHTASRIDHILIREGLLKKIRTADIVEADAFDSDHCAVLLFLRNKQQTSDNTNNFIEVRKGLKDKNKWKEFKNSLPPPPINHQDTDQASADFAKGIIENYNTTFPPHQIHKNQMHREIFTRIEYKTIKRNKKLCFHIASHVKKVLYYKHKEDIPHLSNLTTKLNNHKIMATYTDDTILNATKLEKGLNKEFKKIIRRHKREQIKTRVEKIIESIHKDGHNVFKVLRPYEKNYTGCIIKGDKAITNQEEIDNTLHSTWQEIFNKNKKEDEGLSEFLKYVPAAPSPPPPPDFSTSNIKYVINAKLPTAPGISKVSWKMLQNCPETYYTYLSKFFTKCYQENIHPKSWKQGITTLIPKPNTPPTPDGFRPITLLSVEYKLYTMIIGEALLKWALKNDIIPQSQNGALPDRGCDACLWNIIPVINECNKHSKEMHIMYINYSKAFDSVEHWVLKSILSHIGTGYMGEIILNLIKDSTTKLKFNNKIIDKEIDLQRGTKQGDGISPLLFNIFMTPVLKTLEAENEGISINGFNFNCAAIIDDVVYGSSTATEAEKATNIVKKFSEITGININPKKLAYAWKNCTSTFRLEYQGKPFELLGEGKSYRYLGFWLNLDLDWTDLRTHLENQVRTILGVICSKYYLPSPLLVKLINATVHAVVGYRMQIIHFHPEWIAKIENIIMSFLCKTTKVNLFCPPMWTLATNLTPLTYTNLSRLTNSVWRNLMTPNSLAENNLLALLGTAPK